MSAPAAEGLTDDDRAWCEMLDMENERRASPDLVRRRLLTIISNFHNSLALAPRPRTPEPDAASDAARLADAQTIIETLGRLARVEAHDKVEPGAYHSFVLGSRFDVAIRRLAQHILDAARQRAAARDVTT